MDGRWKLNNYLHAVGGIKVSFSYDGGANGTKHLNNRCVVRFLINQPDKSPEQIVREENSKLNVGLVLLTENTLTEKSPQLIDELYNICTEHSISDSPKAVVRRRDYFLKKNRRIN